jgi:hypothetical protein
MQTMRVMQFITIANIYSLNLPNYIGRPFVAAHGEEPSLAQSTV